MGCINPLTFNLLGRTIDEGRLKLVDILGSGSNGVAFLATEQLGSSSSLGKYAVKCLPKAHPGSSHYLCQQREIQHHRMVSSHPHIVTLHRVVEEAGYIFLVLDYCPGGDLFSFFTDRFTFSGDVTWVRSIFLQILDAVDACHKAGIYHRDIKPENILCSADYTQVYLGDFGLSTMNLYSKSFRVGSYQYMSPECIRYDVAQDAYSTVNNDIWALGPILTIMICGRSPWECAMSKDEAFKSYSRDPNFLGKVLPISDGANLILRHIFTRRERNRVCLEYLRDLVLRLDTFFMSPENIVKGGQTLKSVAETYFRKSQQYLIHCEMNTSYGDVLDLRDRRRILAPKRTSAEGAEYLSEVSLRCPPQPREPDIQEVNRSHPTNPLGTLSDGSDGFTLKMPALPPKAYTPPRYQRCTVKSSPAISCTTDQVEARSSGRVRRAVERVF